MLISYEQEKNRRQVPKTAEYLKLKNYCDYVYCYLQVNSLFDEEGGFRYILKKDCKYTMVARDLNMTRQTASDKIKKLIQLGLVKEEDHRYILVNLDKTLAELVPYTTLRILTSTVKDKVISVFVYFLVRFRAEHQKPFIFTMKQVKTVVGIGESRSTDYIVTDILTVLSKLGLIKYEKLIDNSEEGTFKTYYKILDMSNKIENVETELKAASL